MTQPSPSAIARGRPIGLVGRVGLKLDLVLFLEPSL